jgi:cellulase
MHAQPGDRSCSNPAIGGAHDGPVLVYMAKVSDATTATTGSFFKVAEDGYKGTTPTWGTEILNANCGKRAFTVPKSLAAGQYLVRAEVLALHAGVCIVLPGQGYRWRKCEPDWCFFPGRLQAV